jgi:hypothetical protein
MKGNLFRTSVDKYIKGTIYLFLELDGPMPCNPLTCCQFTTGLWQTLPMSRNSARNEVMHEPCETIDYACSRSTDAGDAVIGCSVEGV